LIAVSPRESSPACGDLVGCVARNLKENAEWQMELLDQSSRPIFRVRMVAEKPD
jgi:hypothetical protein